MKLFFWNLADWCVLATIVWAYDLHTPLATRLLNAASVWVGIANVVAILHLISLFVYKEAQLQLQDQTKSSSHWQTLNYWSSFFVSLIVFAWIGWIFTFGIRLFHQLIIEIITIKKKK